MDGAAMVRKLVRQCERGMYTPLEVVARLIEAAAECPPADLAPAIPADLLAHLRAETAEPPQDPKDVLLVRGVNYLPGTDISARAAEAQRTCFDGIWNWHRYFAAAQAPG
jgi:hypothetical protein